MLKLTNFVFLSTGHNVENSTIWWQVNYCLTENWTSRLRVWNSFSHSLCLLFPGGREMSVVSVTWNKVYWRSFRLLISGVAPGVSVSMNDSFVSRLRWRRPTVWVCKTNWYTLSVENETGGGPGQYYKPHLSLIVVATEKILRQNIFVSKVKIRILTFLFIGLNLQTKLCYITFNVQICDHRPLPHSVMVYWRVTQYFLSWPNKLSLAGGHCLNSSGEHSLLPFGLTMGRTQTKSSPSWLCLLNVVVRCSVCDYLEKTPTSFSFTNFGTYTE